MLLIDGYNVLFALGMVPHDVKEGDLHRARRALLDLLADGLGDSVKKCTVVFDGTRAPGRLPRETIYRGIEVRFTQRREEADDLIDWLIKQCSAPKQLTVVSSDHRLIEAAARRRAASVKSQDFLQWLEKQKQPGQRPPASSAVTPQERQEWVQAFSHLDQEFADSRTFPEKAWSEELEQSEEDPGDPRKRHRMKPPE
jgi:predicted RNA-binding protein with PIN domain